MNILNFENSLRSVFLRHRLVFWYDATGEWSDTFEAVSDDNAIKIKVEDNEFGTKVRIVRDANPTSKYLLYLPSARPPDTENWLLDLLMQGHEFSADRASMVLHEAGLPLEFRYLVEEHANFFKSSPRVSALKTALAADDGAREIRLKMMAILAESAATIDDLLLCFLNKKVNEEAKLTDPVAEHFDASGLTVAFWKEVERLFRYNATTPSLRDFAITLFRGANPLDGAVELSPHSLVFLQRWKDSAKYREAFIKWSHQMQEELQIKAALTERGDEAVLSEADAFELFEQFVLHRLCSNFEAVVEPSEVRATIQQRRSSFWWSNHSDGYAALEQAVLLRELLNSTELTMDSFDSGLNRYTASWWRLDRAYRCCNFHLRRYNQVQLMQQIADWVEKNYVNNFLLPLADRWSDQVRPLDKWHSETFTPQRRFFELYVQPFRSKGQKVLVIVSDALRYEAAQEFAERLHTANRWTTEVDALLSSLPSYTQLGMASLLPNKRINIDPETQNVTVDGHSATGTANRAEILALACDSKATALQAEEFLELNSKTDGRALMREHDIVYVFHNVIDKTGDALTTEAKTFDAVERAFEELEQIVKKAANINANNMLLTADHGFLFQQNAVNQSDATPLPPASQWLSRNRRFALGKVVAATPNIKIFESGALGLGEGWLAAFPLGLGRFPLQGSGKRYVHGGISLQEILVPVVRLHKARADDTGNVEIELLNLPSKITTGQFGFSLFQDRAAGGKVLPRTLRVGLFATDGTLLSETKTVTFDSDESEARRRETNLLLVLSHAADGFNNREVELRLEEELAGTNQMVLYKMHRLRIQKPFASDFDE